MRVEALHVERRFASAHALRGVTLDIPSGACLSLLGPSGCGKSTFLRLLAGLDQPTRGSIRFDGRDVAGLAPPERGVGLVVQDAGLYPNLTLRDNLAAAGSGRGLDADIAAAAESLGISAQLASRPGEVSGGQRRRAALARELVRRPRLLLLDEPTASLDPDAARDARALIAQLRAALRCTVVLATHDQDEAMALGDFIAVMHDGRVLQVASPRDLWHAPASRRIARFVGQPPMNMIPGAIENPASPRFVPTCGLAPLDLPGLRGSALPEAFGRDLDLGLRPAALAVGTGTWTMAVSHVERLMHRTDLTLEGHGLRLMASGPVDPTLGDAVHLRPVLRGAMFFEREGDGRRLDLEVHA